MQEERNRKVVREFIRVFKNERNLDGVAQLFDDRFVHHFRMPLPAGLEGLKQVGRMMHGAFPDLVVTEEDLIASGDKVVERSSAAGTHKGPMMGELPTNKKAYWSEIFIYRLVDGKIVELWVEGSTLELFQQIGALPQPG
jgi:predicted ester cyclase